MAWPLASHFSAMMQTPRLAFRDPRLKECVIERDERNQPKPRSGAFAVVFRGDHPERGETFAIRVFTTESPERRERYDLIAAYLKDKRLRSLVNFTYHDSSVRASDGKWYPLILMDWVPGETLFRWVRIKARAGDRPALMRVAQQWVELVRELAEARIAHGDLQHANVMVTDREELKLVDYDGMCVPALVGRRNLEVGVEPYQHPERNPSTPLALDLDHFSALLIYTALRALAADPGLWIRYVDRPDYDKLLFRPDDFTAPGSSALYLDLVQSPDPDVRDLTVRLFESACRPMHDVPPLAQIISSYGQVERLLRDRQWADAVELLSRRGNFRDAPDHLKPLIGEAFRCVCQQQALSALLAVPEEAEERTDRRLASAWNDDLFANLSAAQRHRPRVEEARQRVEVLDEIHLLAQRPVDRINFASEQAIADLASRLPRGYAYSLKNRVRLARRRTRALRRLAGALREPISETEVALAWQQVVEASAEALADPDWRARIDLALERYVTIQTLKQIPDHLPPDQYDRRILAAWNEPLLGDSVEAEPWREPWRRAVRRINAVGRLSEALGQGDDEQIAAAGACPELAGYPLPAEWNRTLAAARQRSQRAARLIAALDGEQPEEFIASFDSRLIRTRRGQLASRWEQIVAWTRAYVVPCAVVGLRPAVGRASLSRPEGASGPLRLRWSWPQPRIAESCLWTVTRAEPHPGDDPRRLALLAEGLLDRATWERQGGYLDLEPPADWQGATVSVWAVIDLKPERLFSHPLVLGQLSAATRTGLAGRLLALMRGAL